MMALGRQTTASLLFVLLALAGSVGAEDLGAMAQAAKEAYHPLDQADLTAARADLDGAFTALDARLARAGGTADGWREYLDWSQLKQELAKADGPDLAFLEKTFGRLSTGDEGLGLTCFSGLRDSIRGYVGVARGIGDENLKGRYEKVLDALAGCLEAHAKSPNGEDAAMISAYLRWLKDARQAPELCEAIRSSSLNQNFHVQVSAGLLNAAMARDVDQTDPVRDVILGTRLHGSGRTTGSVSVELLPSDDHATIVTVMKGTNVSDTTGYNGPVVVRANGTTELTTRKEILIDGERLWSLPAQADAVTHSHIRSICAKNGMRLIEKMAWKRAGRQKCQSEAIAAQHAECQARARFDDEVEALIGPANEKIQTKVRGPLMERGLYPEELQYSTGTDFLNVAMLQAGPFDLGATTEAPETVADADLRVQIHESTINNFTSAALAGMILREPRVQEAVKNLVGKLPKELESEEDALPWGIAFHGARPIWVAFGDNQFTVSIRGRSFYEGENRHPGMDVTVTYKIISEGESFKAVRQGEVQIFPPGFDPDGDQQLTAQQTAIRRILQRRLGRLFEEEIIPKGLVLPEEWSRAGTLNLVQWEAKDGWLVLSWKRADQPAAQPQPEAAVAQVSQ